MKKNVIGKLGHRRNRFIKFCEKSRTRPGGDFEGIADVGLKVTVQLRVAACNLF